MKVIPRYMQVMNYYLALIESGKLSDGDKMPTEEEICNLFNVSRITVRRALDGLTQEGYIYKVHGKGSFITTKKTDIQLNHLQGFSEEMRALGLEPTTRLISKDIIAPSEAVAAHLGIDTSQKIYFITRLRCADGIPMAIERVHIPFFRFPGIENEDLTKSLYEILRQNYGCESSKAVQCIQAGIASKVDAELLEIKSGRAVLCISRTTYEQNGRAFEYVQSTYRGDKYQFNVTLNK